MDFYDIDFEDEVLDALDAMNFRECTPIQEKTIVPLMEGHDLIGVAQTGTGKTAAYLLPVLNKLCRGGYPENAINCIIMAPTRELAQQIDRQLEGFTYFMPVSSVAVYGGTTVYDTVKSCVVCHSVLIFLLQPRDVLLAT